MCNMFYNMLDNFTNCQYTCTCSAHAKIREKETIFSNASAAHATLPGLTVQKKFSLINVLHVFRHTHIVAQYYPFKLQYVHVQRIDKGDNKIIILYYTKIWQL